MERQSKLKLCLGKSYVREVGSKNNPSLVIPIDKREAKDNDIKCGDRVKIFVEKIDGE